MDADNLQIAEIGKTPDPATYLAVERTELALERTHLAWIRTMFTTMTAGLAIDKGLEIIHEKRLLKNSALVENGHVIGIFVTSFGILLLFIETRQFLKQSRKLAFMKKVKFSFFSTGLILAILVMIMGVALIYLMITTG